MRPHTPYLPRLVFVVVMASALGLGIYLATTLHGITLGDGGPVLWTAPCIRDEVAAGFDPWTGLPHGRTFVFGGCGPLSGPETSAVEPIPADMVSRRAIPVPLGIALAASAAILYLAWIDARDSARHRAPEQSG